MSLFLVGGGYDDSLVEVYDELVSQARHHNADAPSAVVVAGPPSESADHATVIGVSFASSADAAPFSFDWGAQAVNANAMTAHEIVAAPVNFFIALPPWQMSERYLPDRPQVLGRPSARGRESEGRPRHGTDEALSFSVPRSQRSVIAPGDAAEHHAFAHVAGTLVVPSPYGAELASG